MVKQKVIRVAVNHTRSLACRLKDLTLSDSRPESILRLGDLSADHMERLLIGLLPQCLPLPELLITSFVFLEQCPYNVDTPLSISSYDGVVRSHLDLSVTIGDVLWHKAGADYHS